MVIPGGGWSTVEFVAAGGALVAWRVVAAASRLSLGFEGRRGGAVVGLAVEAEWRGAVQDGVIGVAAVANWWGLAA